MTESKVIYKEENGRVRVIRGEVHDYLGLSFIAIERDDGRYMIARDQILRIETRQPRAQYVERRGAESPIVGQMAAGAYERSRDRRDELHVVI